MKVADSSHYLEKFNEVLNLVEKECIEGDELVLDISRWFEGNTAYVYSRG